MCFHRLHPHLRHAIRHELGWKSLRPVQEQTIEAVLDGCNTVVLAPTAGGKTEASMFPVLSRILSEDLSPVAALYVSPIRALLNNQEQRLRQYARMVGLDAFKWHGDVADTARERFRQRPVHLLMTTPESLEVMLISQRTDARHLFASLSCVVIDEVHAFAGDDRGAHLVSLLERISLLCDQDLQRIGLSATVGNPGVIGRWLQGSSARPFRLVDPPRDVVDRDLRIELCDDVEHAAVGIGAIARGRKSLVFTESRAQAERVAHSLSGRGVDVFVHHSSVSRADRSQAEEQFTSGQNTAIVCTSTMELGIDVGDLDQVIQVDTPGTVASFLQRVGRTGRRAGSRSTCRFFCLDPTRMLKAVALLRLAERGWVEDVAPSQDAVHILAHQIMALGLQQGGISRHHVRSWLSKAFPFEALAPERVSGLVDRMLSEDILYESGGLLSLGRRGEKLYGRRHFFELYAVFSTPPMLRVLHGRTEIGLIQSLFVQSGEEPERLRFRLAGRSWQVTEVDWRKATVRVVPAEKGRVPSWLGSPAVDSYELCQEMRATLVTEGPEGKWLSEPAQRELGFLREEYAGVLESEPALEADGVDTHWHTFAGGRVNRLLSAALEHATGSKWTAGNLSIRSSEAGLATTRAAISELHDSDWHGLAVSVAHGMQRGRLSKFQPCMPPREEDLLLASRLLDVEATMRLSGAEPVPLSLGHIPARADVPKSSLFERLPVRWIDDDAALAEVCAALASAARVGLDVETTLDMKRLCLVQLAGPDWVAIVDWLADLEPAPLGRLLADPRVEKLIHYAPFEQRVLGAVGLRIANVFDTHEDSIRRHGRHALGGHSLAAVCAREIGVDIDKSQQTSDWTRRPLLASQLDYAAMDAEVLLQVRAATA